jgi:DNA-binding MltR family transcriptional regulator
LRSFFLPKLSKSRAPDELLEGDTPLATFSARTKICRRLGLIDETLYIALDKLRRLRNLSAHSVSFDHTGSPARELIAELRARVSTRGSFELAKARYFDADELKSIEEMQCMMLTLCILLEAIKEKVKPTQGSKRALRISAK